MRFPHILPRLRLWLKGQRITKQIFVMSARLDQARARLQKEIDSLRDQQTELEDHIRDKQGKLDLLEIDIKEYQQQVIKQEQEIDRLKAENKIQGEVTIPGLVEANSLLLDRIREERSISISRHQVASGDR